MICKRVNAELVHIILEKFICQDLRLKELKLMELILRSFNLRSSNLRRTDLRSSNSRRSNLRSPSLRILNLWKSRPYGDRISKLTISNTSSKAYFVIKMNIFGNFRVYFLSSLIDKLPKNKVQKNCIYINIWLICINIFIHDIPFHSKEK